ncbi:c-type cytochrome biogenesis protein CcmI [Thioalkalivibrio sp.]|uniref:c-type cytochrome biogenesis protein CcmI n=1 Tax=Thioalkalivibrio sp. TaxID=2093813 RepID=UPI00397473E2
MTLFWILAAALTLAALLFLFLPLLRTRAPGAPISTEAMDARVSVYRSQLADLESDRDSGAISEEQFNTARIDLQRSLLETSAQQAADRTEYGGRSLRWPAAVGSLLVVPVVAVLIYQGYGAGASGLDPQARAPQQAGEAQMDGGVEEAVMALSARLEDNPEDPEGWALLGRSFLFMEQPRAAAGAYAQALRHGGDEDPDILVTYADLLGSLDGGDLSARALPFVNRALEIEPDHANALWLAGLAAFRASDYETTREYWERLEQQLEPGTQEAQLIRSNLEEVRSRLNSAGPNRENNGPPEN